jgi:hypothetical protein
MESASINPPRIPPSQGGKVNVCKSRLRTRSRLIQRRWPEAGRSVVAQFLRVAQDAGANPRPGRESHSRPPHDAGRVPFLHSPLRCPRGIGTIDPDAGQKMHRVRVAALNFPGPRAEFRQLVRQDFIERFSLGYRTIHTNPKRKRGGLPIHPSLTLRVSVMVSTFFLCATLE